jgi:hypothetical protein
MGYRITPILGNDVQDLIVRLSGFCQEIVGTFGAGVVCASSVHHPERRLPSLSSA